MFDEFRKEIDSHADPERAIQQQRFFKTGPGEYGEGQVYLGLINPILRRVAKKYPDLSLADISKILRGKVNTYKFAALVVLVAQFRKSDEVRQKKIYEFYIKHAKNIDNWDLVDTSTPHIVGAWLVDHDRSILYRLARSKNLWERRISVLATFAFLRNGDFKDMIKIAEIHLCDPHDLIHKAVGWMLREIGKRDIRVLRKFLDKYSRTMPRTMLRYSIEKMSKKERAHYMKK